LGFTLEIDDGSMDVKLKCAIGWGFEEWILRFGEMLELIKPINLRRNISQRIINAKDICK